MIEQVIRELQVRNWRLAIVETSSGGLLSTKFIEQDGVSAVFAEAIVAYDLHSKLERLHVDKRLIDVHGSVSEATAEAMARGMGKNTDADVVISITGISGPKGGTAVKPVGLTYICVAIGAEIITQQYQFSGHRLAIMEQTVQAAVEQLYNQLFIKEE